MRRTRLYTFLTSIIILILLLAVLPISASAASKGLITAPANHVDEGATLQLSTNMSGVVTWTSSNTSVATISSSGRVTGKLAGQVTITATCSGYTTANYTVYVTVPDGLYYFKNASSGLCMQTTADTTYVYTQDSTSDGRIPQLWKVTHISNGNYVIRPIRDLSVALTVNASGFLAVADAPANDSSVPASMYWRIIKNGFGYAIKLNGYDSQTAMPTTNGVPGVPVHPSNWTSSLTCHWDLVNTAGVFIRDSSTLEVVTTQTARSVDRFSNATLSSLGLTYDFAGNISGLTWSSNNYNVASIDPSGTITSKEIGTATITATITVNGVSYSSSYKLYVVLPRSGSELDYEPSLWNAVPVLNSNGYYVKHYTNCYSYAVNSQYIPGTTSLGPMQPGMSEGITYSSSSITASLIVDCVEIDAENYNFLFEACSKNDQPDVGTYKVALVVDPGSDYHWYRQNSDGTWSHKRGNTDVTNYDASGNIILDPATADRNYSTDLNYTVFVGYYFVTPLNNYYYLIPDSGLTRSGPVEEQQCIAFDKNTPELPTLAEVRLITTGMSYSEVTELIGLPQEQTTFGLTVVKYNIAESNSYLSVQYVLQNGIYTVFSCQIEE